ncbi:MAG TPA: LysM peptidoglycan-binding domain-containing protein [bacterium]|jgi:murein DD-endopeptidase MepM/ murein hydrolase activator NlpD
MARSARPYFAALLSAALFIPTTSLSPASAKPSIAFLLTNQTERLVSHAFGALLPGPNLRIVRTSPRLPSAQPTPLAKPVASTVVIREGQALWDIARAHGRSVEAIVAANHLRNAELLRPGQTLIIPAASAGPATPLAPAAVRKPVGGQPVSHVVVAGDTLWSVARRYGLSVSTLARANAMSETALIHPGQRLALAATSAAATPVASRRTVPSQALTILVTSGQTLSAIAQTYGVSTRALVQANHLRSAHAIRAGQRLTILGSSTAAQLARRTPVAPAAQTVRRTPVTPARVQIPRVSQPLAASLRRGFFRWPARGIITSRFGMRWRRHHNGLDIAAPRGTPIYAGRAGMVIFAGWYFGYGLAVLLSHGGGVMSIYGHASALLVHTGQTVSAGQQIARVGCTGSCTGNHVHFEVRINGRPVNPLRYL